MPQSQLQELISPAQSQILVLGAAILLTVIGALWGFVAARAPGLIAALGGPLIYIGWQVHGVLTARYGLDSLALLMGEAIFVIVAGAGLGWLWSRLIAPKTASKTATQTAPAELVAESATAESATAATAREEAEIHKEN